MRPKIISVLAVLCVLSGLAFPFTASNYFYGTEGDVTVTSEDFTMDGSSYSLIYFDGEPTFLLKDGEIVTDRTELETKVYDYFIQEYYPSEEDVNELKNLTLEYNISRNDGYDWKNKEELVCRQIMFTDKRIDMYIDGEMQKLWCHDETSCDLNAKLLFQAYHDYTGWSSYEQARVPLEEYAYASYGTDFILANISRKLDNMNKDNVVDVMLYIEASIPQLRDYAEDIESTIFRTPRMDDAADKDACYLKCYAICPSFDLDENILDKLENKAEDVFDNLGPLAAYENTSKSLYANTNARLDYYESATTSAGYAAQFSPYEKDGLEVETFARDVTKLVSNTSFSMQVDRMTELRLQIKSDIDDNNFDDLDEEISEYRTLIKTVGEDANELYGIYNETFNAKTGAEKMLFEVGTRDLDPVGAENYENLRTEIAELDDRFADAKSPSEYEELTGDYTHLANDAAAIIMSSKSGGASTAIVYFRGFARNVNEGLAGIAESTDITEVRDIPENQYLTMGTFSLLVFVCLSALAFLIFIYLLKGFSYSGLRYIVIIGFGLAIVLLALFSSFLYVFMYKTSTDATMEEFLADFSGRENIAVVAELSLATSSEESSIKSCAAKMVDSMEENNKTVTIYYMTSGGGCKKVVGSSESNMNEEDCISAITEADSAIYLIPSAIIDEPVLKTTYLSQAEIYATADYYASCPLSMVFK